LKTPCKCWRPAIGLNAPPAHHLAEPVEYMIGQFRPSNRLGASARQSNKFIEKVRQITFSGGVAAAESNLCDGALRYLACLCRVKIDRSGAWNRHRTPIDKVNSDFSSVGAFTAATTQYHRPLKEQCRMFIT